MKLDFRLALCESSLRSKTDAKRRLAVSLAHSRVHFAIAKPQTAPFGYSNNYFPSVKFLKVVRKLFLKSFLTGFFGETLT